MESCRPSAGDPGAARVRTDEARLEVDPAKGRVLPAGSVSVCARRVAAHGAEDPRAGGGCSQRLPGAGSPCFRAATVPRPARLRTEPVRDAGPNGAGPLGDP